MDNKKLIDNIKKRIDIMVATCASIRTLSGAFVFIDRFKDVLLSLNELNVTWDSDRNPFLSNGKRIAYFDLKREFVVYDDFSQENIESMNMDDLKRLNEYMKIMIPLKDEEIMDFQEKKS